MTRKHLTSERLALKATMSNRDVIETPFNGTPAEAMAYYIGKTFNIGVEEDKLVYGCALAIDGVHYNPTTHRHISADEHENNLDLIAARSHARGLRKQPLIGDFIMVEGIPLRFTHSWGESGLQTTCLRLGDATYNGGFHLMSDGRASYSGSLDPVLALDRLELTNETRAGEFWMFSGNDARAHNAVRFMTPCKVYRLK